MPFLESLAVAAAPALISGAAEWFTGGESAEQANSMSSAAAADAFYRQQAAFKSRYYHTVNDLRHAGLNPILAASGGFNVGSGPYVAPAQVFQRQTPKVDLSASAKQMSEASLTQMQEEKTEYDIKKTLSETALNFQKINESITQAIKNRTESNVNVTKEKEIAQNIFNLEQEFLQKAAQIDKIRNEINRIQAETSRTQADIQLINERKKQIRSETVLILNKVKELQYSFNELEKTADVYKGTGGTVIKWIDQIMKSLHIGGGAAVVFKGGK